jgi:hypothetical protein
MMSLSLSVSAATGAGSGGGGSFAIPSGSRRRHECLGQFPIGGGVDLGCSSRDCVICRSCSACSTVRHRHLGMWEPVGISFSQILLPAAADLSF